MKVVGRVNPEKMNDFNNVSLSRKAITRRIAELSPDVKDQVTEKSKSFDFFSIACDESTDASDTSQLLILEVYDDFCSTEELLHLQSLTGTTTGKDILKLR